MSVVVLLLLVVVTFVSGLDPNGTQHKESDTAEKQPNAHQQELPRVEKCSFGSWRSSLSALDAASAFNSFVEMPRVDHVTGGIFWVESDAYRRNVIRQYDPATGRVVTWTGDAFDVRSDVNGGAGGSFIVHNDSVIFSNANDGFLYFQKGAAGQPNPIISDATKSYSNGCFSSEHNILFYVMENKKDKYQKIVAFNITSGEETNMPMDDTFFADPIFSPYSARLAWLQWETPNSIWDETKLLVASLESGKNFKIVKYIRHGSMKMLKWNQYSELLYVHDATDWWNLYINTRRNFEINLTPFSANVGHPTWRIGQMAYDPSPQKGSYDVAVVVGKKFYQVNTLSKKATLIDIPYDSIYGPKYSTTGDKIYMVAGNSTQRVSLIELELKNDETRILLPKPSILPLEDLSRPMSIEFPTSDGNVAFGLFYPPKNSNYNGVEGCLPPLILTVGEGPPEGAKSELDLEVQYFTSRGFAVFDVDHRGRGNRDAKFIREIYGKFGEMDVADVISGAEHLINKEMVNSSKIVIRGRFLGGVTALLSLAFTDLFKAGTVYGAPSNATKLLEEASIYEKGYYQNLFNPLSSHDKNDTARPSSPIDLADNITSATLLFHGSKDRRVHHSHSVLMHESLLEAGAESTLILKTEGQDFSAKGTAECLDEELLFYRTTLGIQDSDTEHKARVYQVQN